MRGDASPLGGRPMTILVTGATGFLGQRALAVARAARRRRCRRCTGPARSPRQSTACAGSPRTSRARSATTCLTGSTAVFHLAQSRRYREFPDGAVDVMEVNTMATTRLLDYCRRRRRRDVRVRLLGRGHRRRPAADRGKRPTGTAATSMRSPSSPASWSWSSSARSCARTRCATSSSTAPASRR